MKPNLAARFSSFGLSLPLVFALVALSMPAGARTFVIPHVLEKSGSIANTPYTFDTTIFVTYNASLHGADQQSAHVEFYLYDEHTGQLMRGSSGNVCGPCGYTLNAQSRKLSIRIDDLILANGGGFDQEVKLGFAVVVVSGSGAEAVNVQGFVVNSHTGPFDLSVFGFDPQPLAAGAARTVVIPHVLETSGKTAVDAYSMDTVLHAAYVGGLPGASAGSAAEVQVYLYDQAGAPMQSGTGTEVCNPCMFGLGTGSDGVGTRKRTIVLDDLITAAGGFGASSVRQGFAVVIVGGADPMNVALQGFVVNAHTSPFDLSVFGFDPQPLAAGTARGASRSFVIPHILEKSGKSANTQFTFDTTIFATYTPGLGGLPQGTGATLDLFLYDDSGAAMVGKNGTDVCAPCTFQLGTGAGNSARKESIRIDDLVTAAGGFDTDVKLGFGVIVVGGSDPDGVNLQGFVVNAHTSPFDLSVFGFQPEEIRATTRKTFVIPHILEKEGLSTDTPFTFDTTLFATYAGGLPGGGQASNAVLNLYLFDSLTGLPLTGATGAVCDPCMFDLSSAHRKASITVDELIETRGGGFGGQPTKSAFGVVVLEGDTANVKMHGFVVNAHTGPFDLSVFGFDPQPILSAQVAPMTIQVGIAGGKPVLFVPTVLGGAYTIEAKGEMDGKWSDSVSFTGDGSVKMVPLPGGVSQQFYRVKGS